MMIGSDGGLVGPNPEGGPVVDRGCFGRSVSERIVDSIGIAVVLVEKVSI